MMSQLPRFLCLFLSCQQQKNTENGAAVTSLRMFVHSSAFVNMLLNMKISPSTRKNLAAIKQIVGYYDRGKLFLLVHYI